MKTNERISKSLGLTQEQLAMLLGITRSRVSLFELNLRPLPEAADRRLSEIVAIAAAADEKTGKQSLSSKEKEHRQSMLKEMIQENDYRQQKLTRKIAALQGKHDNGLKGQVLLDFLASKNDTKEQPLFLFMPPENRNAKYVRNSLQSQIMKYEIKLKVLQYEEQLLKEAMGGKD